MRSPGNHPKYDIIVLVQLMRKLSLKIKYSSSELYEPSIANNLGLIIKQRQTRLFSSKID